jgi:tRNA (mo5U34)-methyltransferase
VCWYVGRVSGAVTAADLREQVADRQWYHTLELAPGLRTPGWFDLREAAAELLPQSLAGRRCLDVGTFDGFWAFEMERRGAAEVVAIDILDPRRWDWPANSTEEVVAALDQRKRGGAGFELAHEALGSAVERRELSVYDLDPADVGEFDFVYVGSLLLHLRDPVRALAAVRSVCTGEAVLVDAIDLPKTLLYRRQPVATLDGRGRPWWWKPNLAALARLAEAAGFELTRPPRRLRLPLGEGHPQRLRSPQLLLSAAGREELLNSWRGDPHGVIAVRPAVG